MAELTRCTANAKLLIKSLLLQWVNAFCFVLPNAVSLVYKPCWKSGGPKFLGKHCHWHQLALTHMQSMNHS